MTASEKCFILRAFWMTACFQSSRRFSLLIRRDLPRTLPLPEARAREVGTPPRVLDRSPGHYREWVNACKSGKRAGSDFVDHAAHLAAVVLMGNIAIRTGQKLYWDAEKKQFKNSPEANRLLHMPYREGWSL